MLTKRLLPENRQVVVVASDRHKAREIDDRLWTYDDTAFIPHCLAAAPEARDTPVVISDMESIEKVAVRDVMVATDGIWPDSFASYEDFILITGAGEKGKEAIDERMESIGGKGYKCKSFDLGKKRS